mmetsp:Transcript_143952/g.401149  ORF Transcript_143952/g.401149 Transcript_143952/m.401149 type:complete len:222 (-) Transcript_143952:802-1467(-)
MLRRTSSLKPSIPPNAAWMMVRILSLSLLRKHLQRRASKSRKAHRTAAGSPSCPSRSTGTNVILAVSLHTCTKVKSSRMHHKRLRYVVPQRMTSSRQPFKKSGKQRKLSSISDWSMQHLSNQILGSRRFRMTKASCQPLRAAHIASASSCQECEMKASHSPSAAFRVRWKRQTSGALLASSAHSTCESSTVRKRRDAWASTSRTGQSPTKPAMLAAATFDL